MIYWLSPLFISAGQVAAILLFFLSENPRGLTRRVGLTAAFFLIHTALQTALYLCGTSDIPGTFLPIQYIPVTLLYYILFTRLWTGLSLPVCGFLSLFFLLTDNCVWPLLVSLSQWLWGVGSLREGAGLPLFLSIALLWVLEGRFLILIRRLLPPLPDIRLDRYTSILTLTSILPFFYIRLFRVPSAGQPDRALRVILALCCLVALVTVVGGIGRSFHEQERLRASQTRHVLQCQQLQFQQKLEDIDAVNRKYHDMKNILLFLSAHDSTRSIQGQIQTILDDIRSYESTAITGNAAIDILLNEKLAVCREKGITCVPYLEGALLSFIEPLDLCTIFGNALDNAIESCEQLREAQDRQISIHTSGQGNSAALTFRNTFARLPEFRSGLPVTTKADKKNHGYGLSNIRYITHKYHGELSCRIEGQEFVLTLLFPRVPPEP